MTIDQLASVLWRRKLAFLAAFLLCVGSVIAVTLVLPKTYQATATLYVGSSQEVLDTSLAEQLTRTYSTLAGNPNVANEVSRRLPEPMSRSELLRRMSFAPVERTPLLLVSAEAGTASEAQTIANTYVTVFADRMAQRFQRSAAQGDVFVSEAAALPSGPSKPNLPLYLAFGTLLSLLLAFGVAMLRERLDTRIRVAQEEDSVLGEPIMARIPRFALRDGRPSREIADRFALLKTNIDFFDEKPARVVMIASSGTGEGKTTVAAQLALACVADGERVVLVEADLRRPSLHRSVIGQPSERRGRNRERRRERSPIGLTHYLVGAAGEEEIVMPHASFPGLSVIWAGVVPPNPTGLLGSERLDSLIETLRSQYDRIILDTCPISVGADASVLASRVEGALYVIDERQTKRTDAQAGLNQLRKVHASLLGAVLNRAETSGVSGYYYGDLPPEDTEVLAPRAGSRRSRASA